MDKDSKLQAPSSEELEGIIEDYLDRELLRWAPVVPKSEYPLARRITQAFYRYDLGKLALLKGGYSVPRPYPHIGTMHHALVDTLHNINLIFSEAQCEHKSVRPSHDRRR